MNQVSEARQADTVIASAAVAGSRYQRVLLGAAILSLAVFIVTLYERVITFDDAFFAEQAYWVNQAGYARSDLFADVLDWGDRQYVYHKLHVWQIALVQQVFGWSAYLFKAIPLLYLAVFCLFAYRYFRDVLTPGDRGRFYLFMALFFTNTYIVQYGYEARPEIMQMTLGFLTYLSLRYGIRSNRHGYILLGALLAGLAALLHLNGVVFIAAGTGLLLFAGRFGLCVLFVLSASCVTALYFSDMIVHDALQVGVAQLLHDPALAHDEFSFLDRLRKFFDAPKRYVSHLYDASLTLLLGMVILYKWKQLTTDTEFRHMFVYVIVADIVLALIGPDNKNAYLLLYMPFFLLVIATFLPEVLRTMRRPQLAYFLIVFYVVSQLGHTISIMQESNADMIARHEKISREFGIQNADRIVAPAVFVFNRMGRANIKAAESYRMMFGDDEQAYTAQNVFDLARKDDRKFIILRHDMLQNLQLGTAQPGDVLFGYRLLGNEADLYIFARVSPQG